MTAPQPNEYHPAQANYVQLAAAFEDVIMLLNSLKDSTYHTFATLPKDKADYAYAPGKWTIKEMLGHMIDTERIFAYRMFCFSRGEQKDLPTFEQNDYAAAADYSNRTLADVANEFKHLREANLYVINNLSDGQIALFGKAGGYPISTKAMLYVMAGHELHHLNILKERYLIS